MKKEFNINVHKSLSARKKWGWLMKLTFLGFLVALAICGVMLYFGFNHQWDPETEPEPVITPSTWWQWLLLILGAITAVAVIVGYTMFVILTTRAFYASQAKYWATEEFRKQKEEALKVDLHTLSKGKLKWYKKMGYINSEEMRKIISEKKADKEKAKTSKH